MSDTKEKLSVHCNHSNDLLSSSEWEKIESIMYPNKASQSGFLKFSERLRAVIEKDEQTLKRLDISCKQIVDRLRTLVHKYYKIRNLIHKCVHTENIGILDEATKNMLKLKLDDDSVCVENKFKISHITYRGAQTCPFQNDQLDTKYHGYEYGSTDFIFTDLTTNKSITFNTLLLHMIEAHHFFEGSVYHRLDPENAITFLGIEPRKSYVSSYQAHIEWSATGGRSFKWDEYLQSCQLNKINFIDALSGYMIDHKLIEILDPVTGQVLMQLDTFIGPKDFDFIEDINIIIEYSLQNVSYYKMREYILLKKNIWNAEYNEKYLSKNKMPSPIYNKEQICEIVNNEKIMKANYLAQDPKDRKATKDMQGYVIVRESNNKSDSYGSPKFYLIDLFGYEASNTFTLGYSHYSLKEYQHIDI